MTITITTKALKTDLITLADLKVAIEPGDSNDTYLESLITRASDFIESECRRKFRREVVTELFNGNSRTSIIMSRFPVMNLDTLTLNGATIATTEYKIIDEAAGEIFMETGWIENVPVGKVITVNILLQPGDIDYSMLYTAGFLLPGDNIITANAFADCAADATAKTFTRTSGKWPLLIDGDKITFGGFTATGLNIEYTVASRTNLVITVDETPSDTESSGQTITLTCQTLPTDLEQAIIELVNIWFTGRGRDSSLKAEKIGDWSGTYTDSMPGFLKSTINRYKVIF